MDFATHKEAARIELPKLGPGKTPVLEGGNASHGMAVSCRWGKRLSEMDSRLQGQHPCMCTRCPSWSYLLGLVNIRRRRPSWWLAHAQTARVPYVAKNAGSDCGTININSY